MAEPRKPDVKIAKGATDGIATLAQKATGDSRRVGKYFDPNEGVRESMAVGKRPSVRVPFLLDHFRYQHFYRSFFSRQALQ